MRNSPDSFFFDFAKVESDLLLIRKCLEDPEIKKGISDAGLNDDQVQVELMKCAPFFNFAGRSYDWLISLQGKYRLYHYWTSRAAWIRKVVGLCSILLFLFFYLPNGVLGNYVKGFKERNIYLISDVIILTGISASIVLLFYNKKYSLRDISIGFLLGRIVDFKSSILILMKSEIIEAQHKIVLEIVDRHLKELVRQYVNSIIDDRGLTFRNVKISGLSQLSDEMYNVNTYSIKKTAFLLENMPGGSVGISGQRGVGKSTLINYFCSGDKAFSIRGKKTKIRFMLSAPVEYDGKEFILHLFGILCKKILMSDGWSLQRIAAVETGRRYKNDFVSIFLWRLWGPVIMAIIGAVCLCFGLVNIVSTLQANKPIVDSAYSKILKNGEVVDSANNKSVIKIEGSDKVQVRNIIESHYTYWLFWVGLILVIVAFIWVVAKSKRFKNDFNYFMERQHVESAVRWLKEIRFQKSLIRGWTGSLKSSWGIETSLNRVEQLAYRQMSTPEIVAAFCSLLEETAFYGPIIIGIDELDKLESDDSAQKFINEIKAVFGVSNCYFLVSISENAMSQFERRGLPVRDVFDSSFDAVVHLDYMDFVMSRELLSRRVIGLSLSFELLSYFMSGGLARDLIRSVRSLYEIDAGRECHIKTLLEEVVKQDIVAKMRAARVNLKKIADTKETKQLRSCIYSLECSEYPHVFIKQTRLELSAVILNDNISAEFERFRDELIAYLYLLESIVKYFDLIIQRPERIESDIVHIEALAKVRRTISVDPIISIGYLEKFWLEVFFN